MAKKLDLSPPALLAAILCDQVIRDGSPVGKPSLIVVFTGISATKYTAVHPHMTLFVQVTNGHGRVKLIFRMIHVGEDDEEIQSPHELDVNFEDVRETKEFVVQIGPVKLKAPGEYRIQVFAGSELLGERRFIAQLIPPQTQEDKS